MESCLTCARNWPIDPRLKTRVVRYTLRSHVTQSPNITYSSIYTLIVLLFHSLSYSATVLSPSPPTVRNSLTLHVLNTLNRLIAVGDFVVPLLRYRKLFRRSLYLIINQTPHCNSVKHLDTLNFSIEYVRNKYRCMVFLYVYVKS